jgi:hypothetical protein
MFYKTAKLRNMLSRLEKQSSAAKAGVNLVKALLGSGAQTGIKAIPKTLGAVAPKIEGALGGAAAKAERAFFPSPGGHMVTHPEYYGAGKAMQRSPRMTPISNTERSLAALRAEQEALMAEHTKGMADAELRWQAMANKPQDPYEFISPFKRSWEQFDKFSHDQRFREKRAIAALIGPLFRAASRAPLTTAAAGLGGMAGYEFARQPKKLANPALLPNASTAPSPNNDAALQKTSLDRQILGALLRR